jgi:Dynein heavy chain C-terminal domain
MLYVHLHVYLLYCRSNAPPYEDSQSIELPVYFAQDRERLLCEVTLPTQDGKDKWVLAGCALFLRE